VTAGGRRARARQALRAEGWAGLIATPGASFAWLTGADIDRTERLVCLGIDRDGEEWLVCPAFEADRLAGSVPEATIVPWDETEDPFRLVAGRIGTPGPWAVEPSTAYHDAARLAAAAPDVEWGDGAPLFEGLRRAKDADEVAALERAIGVAWGVWDAVVGTLAAGATEREVARALDLAFAERDHEGWSMVQFGPSSAVPHVTPGDRELDPGTAVLIDWGGWGPEGFGADLTRSFWWDGVRADPEESPDPWRRVHDTVRAAQAAAIERVAPDAACGDVDAAARETIERAGWGERFVHRTGHGLGREIHEPPYLVAGSDVALREGDVVTVEPGVYLPGSFGVRWEDDVLVTETGARNLSRRDGE